MAHIALQSEDEKFRNDIAELRAAVGLEDLESTSDNTTA